MSNEQNKHDKCSICGKPVAGPPVPNAKVYHYTCLHESLKEVRERNSG